MEFTLDLDLVRRVLSKEHREALKEIRELGVLGALERSQQRHDARIASAADFSALACKAGCSWCCHFSIDVLAAEVFRILDVVERTFTDEQRHRVRAEIRANSAVLKGLGEDERATHNIKCPFLQDGRCSIYSARPQSCRNYHATDAAGCQRSFEHPDDLDIDPQFAPGVYQVGVAHVEAVNRALSDVRLDSSIYEFNAALEAAMADPDARARFQSGAKPFVDLAGDDLPLEFDDLDS